MIMKQQGTFENIIPNLKSTVPNEIMFAVSMA